MIRVRPLTPADAAPWHDLWRGYLAFYETELPETVYAAALARMTDPEAADYHGLIALEDERALGLAHYIFHFHGWQQSQVCYLQDLYVHPEARGGGVGQRLLEAVYTDADAAGHPNVYWMTDASNHAARRLYDRVGRLTPFIKYSR